MQHYLFASRYDCNGTRFQTECSKLWWLYWNFIVSWLFVETRKQYVQAIDYFFIGKRDGFSLQAFYKAHSVKLAWFQSFHYWCRTPTSLNLSCEREWFNQRSSLHLASRLIDFLKWWCWRVVQIAIPVDPNWPTDWSTHLLKD